jgi:hypothetical protein
VTLNSTHIQLYILDSPWLASLIYFHSSENGTLHGPCSQPETLLALRAAVVHCLLLEASFPHPAKERNSARIQRPFGHDCRSQIKLIVVDFVRIASNIFKVNMKSAIPYLQNPREPLLKKTHSLFILASQNCRNSPSLFI